MKKTASDHAQMLLRLAHNDLIAAKSVIPTGTALNTVCFHAQQAAEKSLKAILAFHEVKFPTTHNLSKLIPLVDELGCDLIIQEPEVSSLTRYAVETRYDEDEPSLDTATAALKLADDLYSMILALLVVDDGSNSVQPRDD